MHNANIILVLFVQIGLIVAVSRVVGWIFARLHQPQVMGEMLAGIILGPSLLGWLAPSLYHGLFPEASRQYLNVLSQVGIIFFLFLVGLDLDPALLRKRGRAAIGISAASIALPFILGMGLGVALYPQLFGSYEQQRFLASTLFMGAAMSITAFPVLARILTERNLHKSPVGVLSIAAAAVNDVAAWCILAVVVAVAQPYSGSGQAIWTAAAAGLYLAVMFVLVRPALKRLEIVYERGGRLSQNMVAIVFLLILASAYVTETIGIHALFGAFVLGFIMPKGTLFVRHLSEKLEDFTVVFLLPLFFAYTGLNTQINLISGSTLWGYTLAIIAVACMGKFGGTAITARLFGTPWREATATGILMNTRGLMELVILNIGRELGVISAEVFAMMVIMALVTTAMTTPLLSWIYPTSLFPATAAKPSAGFSVLIPVSLPKSGMPLVHLARMLMGPTGSQGGSSEPEARLFALHLRPPAAHEAYRSGLDEATATDPVLDPLILQARAEDVSVEPLSLVSRDVASDISSLAQAKQVDLVLMGFHKPLIGGTILGGTVHRVLTHCPANVGVFVDRGLRQAQRILVPYLGSGHDRLALELAGRMARNTNAKVTILHVVRPERHLGEPTLGARAVAEKVFEDPTVSGPVAFRVVEDISPVSAVVREARNADLVIIGVAEAWGLESHLFGWHSERIAQECMASLLIVRRHGQIDKAMTPRSVNPVSHMDELEQRQPVAG